MQDVPIRAAATVIVLRNRETTPTVLMGQRGKSAAFMPNKYVFPGGAVDPGDAEVALAGLPDEADLERLRLRGEDTTPGALLAAAIREIWEETGLIFGKPNVDWPVALGWEGFAAKGFAPSAAGFSYIFRAITPPGRPRRFDARFFLVDAGAAQTPLDDFSEAEDELSHLHWVPLDEARQLDLPFITEVVLAEVAAHARSGVLPNKVPFFDNSTDTSRFLRLG